MTKIDQSQAPYFDDYNRDKKYYKILFRPGRAVQARELNQIQSLLQEQIRRVGSSLFVSGSQILPTEAQAVRYTTNTVFLKIPASEFRSSTKSNLSSNLSDIIEENWVGKTIYNADDVRGTVIGYRISDSYNPDAPENGWVRLYVQLNQAAKTGPKKNFSASERVYVDTLDADGKIVGNAKWVTIYPTDSKSRPIGRIGLVDVQDKSVFFFNDYFILVDGQKLFLEPPTEDLEDDTKWTSAQSYEIGLEIVQSIVTFEDDSSILDNATGTPNFSAPGGDRLHIQAILTKTSPKNFDDSKQSYIRLLSIVTGNIEHFWHGKKVDFNAIEVALARRTYDESGNYTVTPFVAEALPFLDNDNGNRGVYKESVLSPAWSEDENNNSEGEAKAKAALIAKEVFELQPVNGEYPVVSPGDATHPGGNRFYPGTSYNRLGDATSFKNLCDSRIGIQVDAGKAYIKGYERQIAGITKTSLKKAQTTDYVINTPILTSTGDYILVTNLHGASFDLTYTVGVHPQLEFYSCILDVDSNGRPNEGNPPSEDLKIGTARILDLKYEGGDPGTSNAVYRLYFFDLKLNDGAKYTDIKSVVSQAGSGTFLANLSLKDSTQTPSIIFTGNVNRTRSVSLTALKADGSSVIKAQPQGTTDLTQAIILFDSETKRDATVDQATVGTAVEVSYKDSTTKTVALIVNSTDTNVEATELDVTEFAKRIDSKTYFVSRPIKANSNPKIYIGTSTQALTTGFTYEYNTITFDTAHAIPDSDSSTKVKVEYIYEAHYALTITLNKPLDSSSAVSLIRTVKKIRGVGTLWRSNPGEKVEEGDYVSLGSGSTRRVYRVFSSPHNDNELNVDPISGTGDVTDVDSKGKFVNAPWEDGAKMTYLIPQNINTTTTSNAGLIFRLPQPSVASLGGGEKGSIDRTKKTVSYSGKRIVTFSGHASQLTILANNKESFPPFSPFDYILIHKQSGFWFNLSQKSPQENSRLPEFFDNTDRSTFVAEVSVSGTSVVFNIPGTTNENDDFIAIVPVAKSDVAASHATKTVQTTFVEADGNEKTVSLQQLDVFRIRRIVRSSGTSFFTPRIDTENPDWKLGDPVPELKNNERDVLSQYTLDTGQTDYYYGISSISIRPGCNLPGGKIRIEFDYFEHHRSTGDYFSVDSYPWYGDEAPISYNDIPDYVSSKGATYNLSSCIDFRVDVKIPTNESNESTPLLFQEYNELPTEYLICSYHMFEPRKDLLYINKDGDIKVHYGEPKLFGDYPLEPQDTMVLYNIEVLPYTSTHKDVILKMVDNRRYTMRDIGKIEKRVKNLEYYTTLSLLERDTKDLVIKDALGQDKFKQGFLTDNFQNESVADVGNINFRAALDKIRGELKPKVAISHIELVETATNNDERRASNYAVLDNIYTLDYKSKKYLEQPLCSRVINVNPYGVQSFLGSLKLSPASDTWRETAVAEPLLIQDSSAYDSARQNYNQDGERIDWGPTHTEWTGEVIQGQPERMKGKENQSVDEAGHNWPARDGMYKLADGTIVSASRIKPGTQVRVPPGYSNSGQLVTYTGVGKAQFRMETTTIHKGFTYQDGIKKSIQDLGFTAPISYGTKIVNSAVAEFIRSKEIVFEGRNFMPNTRLYAFFDDKDVTQYCYPDPGFGTVSVPKSALRGFPKTNMKLKFGRSSIASSDNTSSGTIHELTNIGYDDIVSNTDSLKNAELTGYVTLDSNSDNNTSTLRGTNSKLKANSADLALLALSPGDLLTGDDSGAEGEVADVPLSGGTEIGFVTKNGVAFKHGETVRVTNRLVVEVRGEAAGGSINGTNNTFTIKYLPIGDKSRNTFKVYLRTYFAKGSNHDTPKVPGVDEWDTSIEISKSSYTLSQRTIVISDSYKSSLQPSGNVHDIKRIEVDYDRVGSNYTIIREQAERIGDGTVYEVKHDILEDTKPEVRLLTAGDETDADKFSWAFPGNQITFQAPVAIGTSVLVTYKTASQTFTAVKYNDQTNDASTTGTLFKKELVKGSVVVFQDSSTEVVVAENPTSNISVKVKTVGTSITTPTKAADKLEALQTRYTGKYVDISESKNNTRNILDRKIVSVSYDPAPDTGADILKFELDPTLDMDQTATNESDTVTIMIKSDATSAGEAAKAPELKCNASGTIRGRFIIPDPKVEDNIKFRTGERTFRLTNSATNEISPAVSLASTPYTARGWIDTQQETLVSTRDFKINESSVVGNKVATSYETKSQSWSRVSQRDPIAQSFSIEEKNGVFLTAIDVFFYSKDPTLPITLQIRPLDSGGTPSNLLIYEQTLESEEIVVNKVDLTNTKPITVVGVPSTSPKAIPGFNSGTWSTNTNNENSGLYNVKPSTTDVITIESGNPFSPNTTSRSFTSRGLADYMIPTRFVFTRPLYLAGDNLNYCFVLLTDSVPSGGATSGPALNDTYQVYFAQTGKVDAHGLRSSPVHRKTSLIEGEDEVNFILGTETQIDTITGSDGVLFQSANGISWETDQRADLKYAIHKAVFDVGQSAEIVFTNKTLGFPEGYTRLEADPIETVSGVSRVRVRHANHNIPVGSKVQLFFEDSLANINLNGLPRQILEQAEGHTILSATLDSYTIDLGQAYAATATGFVGGGTVYATKHIRFEELTLLADPVEIPGTQIRWRVSATSGKTPFDTKAIPYTTSDDVAMVLKTDTSFSSSMQVASLLNEKTFLNGKKSLTLYATLSSTDENISPILDAERLSLATKAVRLDSPLGLGTSTQNINDPVFDEFVCLPTTSNDFKAVTVVPGGKLFFTDTDNSLTGESFSEDPQPETDDDGNVIGNPAPQKKIKGVGSLFTVELKVGDIIKHPETGETRIVAEILSDESLTLNEPWSTTLGTSKILITNPPPLKIKTSDEDLAFHLSKLDVGKYLSISGTKVVDENGIEGNFRDFTDALILNVSYTPNETQNDPQLDAPKLCEVTVDHVLPARISGDTLFDNGGGFEGDLGSATTVRITQRDMYVDEIAPEMASETPSTASKYICKPFVISNPANTLKVMFDGCRPEGCEIVLYYKTTKQTETSSIRSIPWKKLEYSVEKDSVLTFATPATNASHEAFSAYEANAVQIEPFTVAQVKIVLRGENPARYPKIKNLRVLALEE